MFTLAHSDRHIQRTIKDSPPQERFKEIVVVVVSLTCHANFFRHPPHLRGTVNTDLEATLEPPTNLSVAVLPASSTSRSELPVKAFERRLLLPIVLVVAVDFMGLGIVVPLLPYYIERTGASAFTVGTIISVFAFCQFLAGPFLGQLSDRYGRKPILLLSQLGSLAGYVIFALSNTLWLIFLSRIIDGLSAGNMSVAQAFVSDHTSLSDRTKGFGLIGKRPSGVGMMIGPVQSADCSPPAISTRRCGPLHRFLRWSLILTFILLPRKVTHGRAHEHSESFPFRTDLGYAFRAPTTGFGIAWLMTALSTLLLSAYMRPVRRCFWPDDSPLGRAIHSTLKWTLDWYSRISRLSTSSFRCFL